MADRLSDAEVDAALARLDGWQREGDAITKEFRFQDFRAAMWFLNASAAVADLMDHHPEWSNVYNRVTVRLSTHDAGGLTDKDIGLANAMNKAAGG
jgi:4a-hydroxytetrahydrobiopterin dehydratase